MLFLESSKVCTHPEEFCQCLTKIIAEFSPVSKEVSSLWPRFFLLIYFFFFSPLQLLAALCLRVYLFLSIVTELSLSPVYYLQAQGQLTVSVATIFPLPFFDFPSRIPGRITLGKGTAKLQSGWSLSLSYRGL